MRKNPKNRNGLSFLAALCAVLAAGVTGLPAAQAQEAAKAQEAGRATTATSSPALPPAPQRAAAPAAKPATAMEATTAAAIQAASHAGVPVANRSNAPAANSAMAPDAKPAVASAVNPAAAPDANPAAAPTAKPATARAANPAKRYYVEFRSRSALSYGHTFLVHGKLNAKGQLGQLKESQVAGLHPATTSSIPWMVGHIVPVVSETGFSDGDIEDEYLTARFRVLLTEDEYKKVSAFIEEHQRNSPLWHAVLYNCNAWVGDVAKFMGLKIPYTTLVYPDEYITELAELNGEKVLPPEPAKPPASNKPAADKPVAQQASASAPAAPTLRDN